MKRHYAPKTLLVLNTTEKRAGDCWLGFGPEDQGCDLNLSVTGNLEEAAANLFRMLHTLDAQGASRIIVSPIPEHGLGLAINDRLRRASYSTRKEVIL